jgi:hypothetical protein
MAKPQQAQPQSEDADQKLEATEVRDVRDSSPRAAGPDLSGKRLRAIPAKGGTTVEVKRGDFAKHGIDHPDVKFDFRRDRFTLPVGKERGISEEAADFLSANYPTSFEYMSQPSDAGDDEGE